MRYIAVTESEFQGGKAADLRADYDTLCKHFGEPHYFDLEDTNEKVQVQWTVRFEDGTIGAIWDWKCYGEAPETIYDWSIGSDKHAAGLIAEVLGTEGNVR